LVVGRQSSVVNKMNEPYTGPTRVMSRSQQPKPIKPRRSFWGTLRLVLLILLLIGLVLVGLFYWQVRSVAQAIVVPDVRANPPIASPLLGTNLLIIGVDERPDNPEEGVRADTLILTRLDAGSRRAALLSIPRDTQVDVLDIGTTKINVAYGQGYARAQELYGSEASPQQGGMALAGQTVEGFLAMPNRGLRVDYTAQINFAGFVGLIDALGGVTIDVPKQIIDTEYPTPDFGITTVIFEPGVQQMDGERALIYARTRHSDSDFGRAQRQQQVISAMVAKFRDLGWFGRIAALPALLGSVRGENGRPPAVLTTMPIDRIDVLVGLVGLAGSIDPQNIERLAISPETVAVSEIGSNLVWDAAGVQEMLTRLLTPPNITDEAALIQVFNGTEVSGLAGRVSLELEQEGFRMVPPGNAPPGDYPRSIVYDQRGKPATAQALARRLDAEVRTGAPEGFFSEADVVVVLGANATTE
jgi:polyisoprenyl-teichoic acid--peptidoglycan teichoic acid transferase